MGVRREQKSVVQDKDFYGLASALDSHDLPPMAAQKAVNTKVDLEGQIKIRQGIKPVVFEDLC